MKTIKIIAEIGINHNGDVDQAYALIKFAFESQVRGVKLQYQNLDNAYGNDTNQIGDEMLSSEIRRNYLLPESIFSLVDKARYLGVKSQMISFDVLDMYNFSNYM